MKPMKQPVIGLLIALAVVFLLPVTAYADDDSWLTIPIHIFNEPGDWENSVDLANKTKVVLIDQADQSEVGPMQQMTKPGFTFQLQQKDLKSDGSYKVVVKTIPEGYEIVPAGVVQYDGHPSPINDNDTVTYKPTDRINKQSHYLAFRKTYNLQGKENQTLTVGDTIPAAKDLIANAGELPAGATYTYVTEPSTAHPGAVQATIKAVFPNLHEKEIRVELNVVARPADADGQQGAEEAVHHIPDRVTSFVPTARPTGLIPVQPVRQIVASQQVQAPVAPAQQAMELPRTGSADVSLTTLLAALISGFGLMTVLFGKRI